MGQTNYRISWGEIMSAATSQAQSMPGIDYDSAINVHICRNGVPDRVGGIREPGFSVFSQRPGMCGKSEREKST